MNHRIHLIEPLEARIAPAFIFEIRADSKAVRWTDVDGDIVTLTASKGVLDGSLFYFLDQEPGDEGRQLAMLDLSGLGVAAKGISLTFAAKRTAGFGDGSVNVGSINASGLDLGAIRIPGDLGAIVAGDSILTTPAVTALTVTSAGAFGTATQGGSEPTLTWFFRGKIGAVTVKGDFFAGFDVLDNDDTNGSFNRDASTGAITIWGDLVGGSDMLTGVPGFGSGHIFAEGNMGAVKILGEVFGGSSPFGGSVFAYGTIPSVTVGRNLFGGGAENTGSISGALGSVKIGGSIYGRDFLNTGIVYSTGPTASVTVDGDLIGGSESNTGHIYAFSLGTVKIGGSIIGGDSPRDENGVLFPGDEGSYIIRNSGAVGAFTNIGSVSVARDVVAGEGGFAGAIFTEPFQRGNIKSVTIGGTLQGFSFIDDGEGTLLQVPTGVYSDGQLGAVKVGAISGSDPANPAAIVALGKSHPVNSSQALAIASVTVARGANNAVIAAGFSATGEALNPDVQIGVIKIANSFTGSSISAGVPYTGNGFGDEGSAIIPPSPAFGDNTTIRSRIASLTVGGYVFGNPTFYVDFVNGMVAQEIGAVKIGAAALELTRGTLDFFALGVTQGFFVREVA